MASKLPPIGSPLTTMPVFNDGTTTPGSTAAGETSNLAPETREIQTSDKGKDKVTEGEEEREDYLKYQQYKAFLARCEEELSLRQGVLTKNVSRRASRSRKQVIEVEETSSGEGYSDEAPRHKKRKSRSKTAYESSKFDQIYTSSSEEGIELGTRRRRQIQRHEDEEGREKTLKPHVKGPREKTLKPGWRRRGRMSQAS